MAHYAFLDENNIVTEVITGIDETELIEGLNPETWYGNFRGQVCKRTSYNGNIRKNYAGIGFSYDPALDAFIPPKPYPSWILNEETCRWDAPVAKPDNENPYIWDEETLSWIAGIQSYFTQSIPTSVVALKLDFFQPPSDHFLAVVFIQSSIEKSSILYHFSGSCK